MALKEDGDIQRKGEDIPCGRGERPDMEIQMIDHGGSEQTTDRCVNAGTEKAD